MTPMKRGLLLHTIILFGHPLNCPKDDPDEKGIVTAIWKTEMQERLQSQR